MQCRCGGVTKVVDSRIPGQTSLMREVREYSELLCRRLRVPELKSVRVRTRVCTICGNQFDTVEIPVEILQGG